MNMYIYIYIHKYIRIYTYEYMCIQVIDRCMCVVCVERSVLMEIPIYMSSHPNKTYG